MLGEKSTLHLAESKYIFFVSDIHFGKHNDSVEWVENIREYFSGFFIPKIVSTVHNEPFSIIIAGDIFDNRQSIGIGVLNAAIDVFDRILSTFPNCEIYAIVGNHDLFGKSSNDVNSGKMLVTDRFSLMTEPEIHSLKDGKEILFVPWCEKHEEITTLLRKYSHCGYAVLHADISGASYQNGREITKGVNVSVADKTRIYAGHIHAMQRKKNLVYLGSPYQLDRGDMGQKKGLFYLEYGQDGFTERFIENTVSPKYVSFQYEELENMSIAEFRNAVSNNYLDLHIKDIHVKKFPTTRFTELAMELGCKNVSMVTEKTVVVDGKVVLEMPAAETLYGINSAVSRLNTDAGIEDCIESYIDSLEGIDDEERERVRELSRNYIKIAVEE